MMKTNLQTIFRHPLAIPGALLLSTLLAYINSFPGTFILDDLIIVVQNPLVQHPDLATIFSTDYWHGVENSGLFRPLTILSLALNRLLLGAAPFGFHLVNVLMHAGVVILFWRALLDWEQSQLTATIAALLFAVHPLHGEVVNEVVGRSELLVALFLLAGFIAARRRSFGAGLLVCLCYLLALLSKEHAITFLALLPLWDAFDAGSTRVWKERWLLYGGLLAVAAFWLFWRKFGVINPLPPFRLSEAAAPLAYVDATTRVLTALHHQWLYFGKLLLPIRLQAVYSVADLPEFIRSLLSPAGLLVVAGTLAALAMLVRGWVHREPLALFGTLYLLAFLPTANILFPIGVTMAERLAYFPSVWFCAGAGVLFAALLERPRVRRWAWAAVVCSLLGLGGTTLWRNTHFSSAAQLWSAEVVDNPRDYLGWQSLAESLKAEGNMEDADMALRWMMASAPDYHGGLRSRTGFFLQQKKYEQALPTAAKVFAQSQAKGDLLALAFDSLDLAQIYVGLGECERALTYLEGSAQPLWTLLRTIEIRTAALSCLGRDAEAVEVLARVDRQQINFRLRYQYGASLFRLGRAHEARQQLEEAVRGEDDAEAWNLLGVVCAQQPDWPAAIAAFTKAVELQPDDVEYRENLLRAQREAGKVR